MSRTKSVDVKLIEFESMLHASVQRVGRTVRNLRQEMGGFGSKTPGSGEPGGGKGGRRTVYIKDPTDPVTHRQLEPDVVAGEGKAREVVRPGREVVESVVEDGSFAVPVTPVEVLALRMVGTDQAAITIAEASEVASAMVNGLGAACDLAGVDPGPATDDDFRRLVVLGYARVRRLQRAPMFGPPCPWRPVPDSDELWEALRSADPHVARVFSICQRWGYTPGVPSVPKARAELLAVDLTERWCTSHLRAGDRRARFRGELCEWCYRHGPLLVATWAAPPLELVRLHIDNGKVHAHEVEPFLKAERDRQRNRVKAGR